MDWRGNDVPQYTLWELCSYAEITPPIMKKYQNMLKLGKGHRCGCRTLYTQAQLDAYRTVKALRRAEIHYEGIRITLGSLQRNNKLPPGMYDIIKDQAESVMISMTRVKEKLQVWGSEEEKQDL